MLYTVLNLVMGCLWANKIPETVTAGVNGHGSKIRSDAPRLEYTL